MIRPFFARLIRTISHINFLVLTDVQILNPWFINVERQVFVLSTHTWCIVHSVFKKSYKPSINVLNVRRVQYLNTVWCKSFTSISKILTSMSNIFLKNEHCCLNPTKVLTSVLYQRTDSLNKGIQVLHTSTCLKSVTKRESLSCSKVEHWKLQWG